jgi:hypothetical protein
MTHSMKSLIILFLSINIICSSSFAQNAKTDTFKKLPDKTIFIYGGELKRIFIKYVAELTKKTNPKNLFYSYSYSR